MAGGFVWCSVMKPLALAKLSGEQPAVVIEWIRGGSGNRRGYRAVYALSRMPLAPTASLFFRRRRWQGWRRR